MSKAFVRFPTAAALKAVAILSCMTAGTIAVGGAMRDSVCNSGGAASCADIGNLRCGIQLAYEGKCGGVCFLCTATTALETAICVPLEGETCDDDATIDCGPMSTAKCVRLGIEDCQCSHLGPSEADCGKYPSC
jgi:hypothetical protein